VIQVAEAIAPCVLWIDEIEKGFAGASSSGSTDGGTSARVFGSFLSWLQEKTSPVFVVATANDVSRLPPEMLRKGRWDELWFVDLPSEKEREAIWRIQIEKHGREPGKFKLDALARATEGFTGAEIEQVVCDGLYAAFDKGMELDTVGLSQAIGETVPLSRLMGDSIKGLREWAKGRARLASSHETPDGNSRRLAA
jgi:SpoVK/Ycf46/Vps4 family AAA+-type ATPase